MAGRREGTETRERGRDPCNQQKGRAGRCLIIAGQILRTELKSSQWAACVTPQHWEPPPAFPCPMSWPVQGSPGIVSTQTALGDVSFTALSAFRST